MKLIKGNVGGPTYPDSKIFKQVTICPVQENRSWEEKKHSRFLTRRVCIDAKLKTWGFSRVEKVGSDLS